MIIRPSNLRQRELCPASGNLEAEVPKIDTVYSEEGRKLHDLTPAYLIKGDEILKGLDEDEKDKVIYCAEELKKIKAKFNSNSIIISELSLSEQMEELGLTGGTADIVIVDIDANRGAVIDFKMGFVYTDHPKINAQIQAYVLGVYMKYGLSEIEAYIIQPLANEQSRNCTFKGIDFNAIHLRIDDIIKACNIENPIILQGEKQCQFCSAIHSCPAQNKIVSLVPQNENVITYFAGLDLYDRKMFYEKLLVASKFFNRALEGVTESVKNGIEIEDYELGAGKKGRFWKDENDAEIQMRNLALEQNKDPDLTRESKLLSPSKADKLFGKGVMDDYVASKEGKPVIKKKKKVLT